MDARQGSAATTTIFQTLEPGDGVAAGDDLYGGTFRLLERVFHCWGLEVTFAADSSPEAYEKAIRSSGSAAFAVAGIADVRCGRHFGVDSAGQGPRNEAISLRAIASRQKTQKEDLKMRTVISIGAVGILVVIGILVSLPPAVVQSAPGPSVVVAASDLNPYQGKQNVQLDYLL
jgi:Cys/Met metabolism PLP-dependent enzyme